MSGTTPPGWYPDPQNPASQRYWDGAAWTSHVAPGTGAPPMATTAASYGYAPAATVAVRSFGFGESVRRGFSRWTNYRDRATIAEYWWFYLFTFLVVLVAYALLLGAIVYFVATADKHDVVRTRSNGTTYTSTDLTPTPAGVAILVAGIVLLLVVALVIFFPQLALTVRRFHDSDKSGWWYLIALVPLGGLVVLVFTLLPGTPGPNRYGPPVTD